MPFTLDAYLSEPLQRGVIPALLTIVVGLVARALSPRSNVKWGVSHGFVFAVQQTSGNVSFHTLTVFVQNLGRAGSENVEVHFNYKPEHLQIWPTLNYDTTTNPENRFTVSVKRLAPKEHFTLELLSGRPLPDVLRVRSDAGDAKKVTIGPSQIFSPWVRRALLFLIWLGFFAIIQNIYLWISR